MRKNKESVHILVELAKPLTSAVTHVEILFYKIVKTFYMIAKRFFQNYKVIKTLVNYSIIFIINTTYHVFPWIYLKFY